MTSPSLGSPVQTPAPRRRAWFISAIVFIVAFDVAFLWQRMAGAHTSEFGGHVEESAHFVTGLMVRDYIAGGFPGSAATYAAHYRDHYPSVFTLGAFPPAFHVAQGVWELAFGYSRMAIMLLMAGLVSVLALQLFQALQKQFGLALAISGALILVGLPLVRESYTQVMPEILAANFMFGSALAFGRFLDRFRTKDAISFGILSGLAVLTQNSGLAVVMVVPVAVLIAGKMQAFRRPALWGGVSLAGLIAGPWMWHFRNVAFSTTVAARGENPLPVPAESLLYHIGQLGSALGIALAVLLCVGGILRLARRGEFSGQWAAAAALLLSLLVYPCFVPAPLEERHIITAIPAAIMFVIGGAVAVQGWFGRRSKDGGQMARPAFAVIVLLLGFAAIEISAQALGISRRKQWSGFGQAAEEIVLEDPGAKRTVMIASDRIGESIFIAELAMREKRPGHRVKLASRELTRSARYGRELSPGFEAEEDVAAWFANAGVDYLLVDESIPEGERERHHDMLFRAVDSHTQRFWPMAKSDVVRDGSTHSAPLTLYRVKHVD